MEYRIIFIEVPLHFIWLLTAIKFKWIEILKQNYHLLQALIILNYIWSPIH